ncbi:2-dehydropantoate 2-reductase [Hesseltinella vesiculosa]|uniref:2-dehydropantoate 2-reductase n=1 Tax=Hesseltinella vesiculosa TaxID=101127 RepID=A0A1X2GNY7_9FUNG|nr:2-dehydropantoate 2-reductase [Hesseltinella vesiculosa]
MSAPSPQILTVGSGAVGSLYSWRLASSAAVTVVCRSSYDIVTKQGFTMTTQKFGDATFHPDHVAKSVEEAVGLNNGRPFDFILVTLKALPLEYDVSKMIEPAVTRGKTTIVLIQNGLGIEEPIVQRFPDNPLISCAAYVKPGHIKMVIPNEHLVVGLYKPSKVDSSQQRQVFVDLLEKGNVDVDLTDDIEQLRWQKLFWNASYSSVCTILQTDTTGSKLAKNTLVNVIRDVARAANANGYEFDEQEQVDLMIGMTEGKAEGYKPSMLLDYERKQPMEVEVILGTALRRAKEKGVAVPYLETAYDLCTALNALNLRSKM